MTRSEANRCYAVCNAIFELSLVSANVRHVQGLLEQTEGLFLGVAELFRFRLGA